MQKADSPITASSAVLSGLITCSPGTEIKLAFSKGHKMFTASPAAYSGSDYSRLWLRERCCVVWTFWPVLVSLPCFSQLFRSTFQKKSNFDKKGPLLSKHYNASRVFETCYPEEYSLYVKRSPTQNYFGIWCCENLWTFFDFSCIEAAC